MALADERDLEPGSGYTATTESFDRQPPQDLAAEQSVLGGMMLSKDAIADVVEKLRPNDFYRPAHQAIYDCILDLYGRGEPADAITVSAELERRQELGRVGGAPYMHTLIATVPTAANAGYYAEIVAEKAVLRRLVEAGTRIVQLGYNGSEGSPIEEVVDRAQAAIYDVTERRTSEDYAALEDLLQPTMDEIDAIASRGGGSQGVPTGFADLDALTNGLHPGQMIIVAARPGVGKALALDTPLPTPDGWTTMGDVAVGDRLLGADGAPVTVVAATEVLRQRPCYEVEFSDGSVIVADAQHQWSVTTRGSASTQPVRSWSRFSELKLGGPTGPGPTGPVAAPRRPTRALPRRGSRATACCPHGRILTTEQLWSALHRDAQTTLAVPNASALRLPEAEAADQPYALGLRLGREASGSPTGYLPAEYLRGSAAQRRALLAGLLDAAGSSVNGSTTLAVTGERLARDVHELVVSLGHPCSMSTDAPGRFRLAFRDGDQRHVVDVRPVPSVPVRCVEVDAADHLYLAGRSMIPTHNSTLGLDFARAASVKHGMGSVIFSLEMGRTEIVMRMLSAEARIRLADMRGGSMTDDDWTRLARRMSEISEAPLFVDDSPNLTMMEIRAKARRLKQRSDIQLIVVDYMQLMTSGKRVESRQQEVSEFSRNLKLLAKELEVPVVAISQLNRGPEQRTDKKPQLADLRESGCLTANTRLLRADTGAETTFAELMRTGERPLVWSLDDRMRLVARPVTNVFSSGTKEVFRVRLTSGREVEVTANHPMLTPDGWMPVGELVAGTRVAAPRQVPEPDQTAAMPEHEVVLLAHLVGAGTFEPESIAYTSADEDDLRIVACAARRLGVAVSDEHSDTIRFADSPDGPHPIRAWLEELGVTASRSIPQRVFALPREQIALFVRHLWSAGSAVRWDGSAPRRVAASRRLADDLALLLLRVGVFARILPEANGHRVVIEGAENQRAFLDQVGARATGMAAVARELRASGSSSSRDTVPEEVRAAVRDLLADQPMTQRDSSRTSETSTRGMTRLACAAAVLGDADLDMLATNDVHWDEIAEITSLGEQPVYDATVAGTHNFVANGIALHNSLEQDADMVILIHRPDAFERDDPRMGEADLILAKHRSGPVSTVTVAHQLHYSRFVDMAQE